MASLWDVTLGTGVPASGSACPTVMDWRLQVFFLSHSGVTGTVSCWCAGSGSCTGSCSGSGSSSEVGSVAPSLVAPAGLVCLEVDNDLCRESRDSGSDLCNDGEVTRRGRF